MWTKYFKVVKIRRGRVITPRHGEIDFSRDDVPVETCKELFEDDFPYLEITEEGKRVLYGVEPPAFDTPNGYSGGEVHANEPVAELVEAEPSSSENEILQETGEAEASPPNRKNNRKRKP